MCADEDVGHVQGRLDDGHDEELQRIRFSENNSERDENGGSGKATFQHSEKFGPNAALNRFHDSGIETP